MSEVIHILSLEKGCMYCHGKRDVLSWEKGCMYYHEKRDACTIIRKMGCVHWHGKGYNNRD